MSKLVVLNLGKGDLKKGFPDVTAQLGEDGNHASVQFKGSLPAAPELTALYRDWQLLYKSVYEALYPSLNWRYCVEIDEGIELEKGGVTNFSAVEFSNLCQELQNKINTWLKSEPFRDIDRKLRTKLDPSEEIRVIVETEDDQVRRLPWHLWNFFEDYQKAVVGLSTPEFEPAPTRKNSIGRVRILAILGNSEGINVQQDRALLEQLPFAQTVFLVEPSRREVDRWLWDKQGWDILFFAGHSSSSENGETGRIFINQTDSLTILQLKNALKAAIARRPGRRTETASRGGCPQVEGKLTALVPENEWGNLGFAVEEYPTFWFYVPYKPNEAPSGHFELLDANNKVVYQTSFTLVGTPGVVSFRLPSEAPLEINKAYHWRFILYCDRQNRSNSAVVEGWVRRVVRPDLESFLKTVTPRERIDLYAENAIWHTALTELAKLRLAEPQNFTLAQDWADLLKDVGLEDLAQKPIVGSVSNPTQSLMNVGFHFVPLRGSKLQPNLLLMHHFNLHILRWSNKRSIPPTCSS